MNIFESFGVDRQHVPEKGSDEFAVCEDGGPSSPQFFLCGEKVVYQAVEIYDMMWKQLQSHKSAIR